MIESVINYKEHLLKKGKSENTVYAYITDINLYMRFLTKEKIDLFKSNKQTILFYIQYLNNQGKSERSISRAAVSLRKFFYYLKEEQLIKEIPTIEYKTSEQRELPEILTVEEVNIIINKVEKTGPKGIRDNAILELMYATGIKVSELVELDEEDINLELKYIKCKDSKHVERIIPIGKNACSSISDYLKIRNRLAQNEVSNLFVNLSGNKLTRQGIWRIVKEYVQISDIDKDVNLNTFRHSFAVHLLQNGADARTVQKLLGNQVMTYMDSYYEAIKSENVDSVYMHAHPRA